MESCFDTGSSFVVDNTNPTKLDRQRYITPAKEHGYRVEGYFMQSKVNDCKARNEKREGKAKIPSTAIAAISNKLELPHKDEGFDSLFYVKIHGDEFIVENWRDSQ
jgi:predicted kinase